MKQLSVTKQMLLGTDSSSDSSISDMPNEHVSDNDSDSDSDDDESDNESDSDRSDSLNSSHLKKKKNDDEAALWAKANRGVSGLAHLFGGKLYLTKGFVNDNVVPNDFVTPKAAPKPAPKLKFSEKF